MNALILKLQLIMDRHSDSPNEPLPNPLIRSHMSKFHYHDSLVAPQNEPALGEPASRQWFKSLASCDGV